MPILLLLDTAEPRRVISSHVIIQVKESFVYLLGKVLNGRHLIRIALSFKFGVHQLPRTDRPSKFKIRSWGARRAGK